MDPWTIAQKKVSLSEEQTDERVSFVDPWLSGINLKDSRFTEAIRSSREYLGESIALHVAGLALFPSISRMTRAPPAHEFHVLVWLRIAWIPFHHHWKGHIPPNDREP